MERMSPSFSRVGAGDAVHDHVVGRGADDGREAVVAEEVRRGAPALEHGAGHGVELERGHPGLGGGPGGLVHLGHHLARLAHLVQFFVVAPHRYSFRSFRFWRWASMAPTTRRVTASGEPVPLMVTSRLALGVPGDQGRRLGLVEVQAALDRLLGVVLALDHLAAADVAGPVDHGRGGRRVVGPAVDADPPRGQPLHDQGGGHLEVDHQVHPEREHDVVEGLGLAGGAGAPVEDEAPAAGVTLGQPAPHHLHHHVVGDELTLVHQLLGPHAEGGLGLDLAAQHVPGRDVRHDVVVRQANALRSLARPPVCRGLRA